ncbi:MAG: CynX/NimT family MFS transporter [Pseudorhodoplanes sp.]
MTSLRAIFLLWLGGSALRLAMFAVLPLLVIIQDDLGMTGTQVAVLSILPIIIFAIAAPPSSLAITRLGPLNALLLGLVTTAIGGGLRGFAYNVWVLYAGTAVMSVGIVAIQTALPTLVRSWLPGRVTFGSAVYTNGLLIGAMAPIAFTVMMIPWLGDSWRAATAFWSVPTLLVALVLLVMAPKDAPAAANPPPWIPDWRNPAMWKIGIILASSSIIFFGTNTFTPACLVRGGRGDLVVPALTVLNAACLPVSFLLMTFARHVERRAWPITLSCLLSIFGMAGIIMTASGWTVFWAGVLGFAVTGMMVQTVALPLMFAAAPDVPRLTAGMFVVAYILVVTFSIVSGWFWDVVGDPRFAFMPVFLGTIPGLIFPYMLFRRRREA